MEITFTYRVTQKYKRWIVLFLVASNLIVVPVFVSVSSGADQAKPAIPKALAEAIARQYPGFAPVGAEDFLKPIAVYAAQEKNPGLLQSVIEADMNADKKKDYAALLINKTSGEFVFTYWLDAGNGKFTPVLLSKSDIKMFSPPGVWRVMEFKKPGSPGLASRDYFCEGCSPEKKKRLDGEYITHAAIETWKGLTPKEGGTTEIETLTYCSEAYYLEENRVESVRVCD